MTRLDAQRQNNERGIVLPDPIREEDVTTQSYKINKLVDQYTQQDVTTTYCVIWYTYESQDGTWEPTHHLMRTKIFQYYKRNKLKTAPGIELVEVG